MTEPHAEPSCPELPGSRLVRSRRWLGCLVVGLALLAGFAPQGFAKKRPRPLASVGTELRQCANGQSGIGRCVGEGGNTGWVRGNLGQSNSLYREGDFVPFRVVITGLRAGTTYTLGIGYDAVEKSLHTYDYLGTYDASEHWPGPPAPQVVPCGGVGDTAGPHACGSDPSTLDVPTDTHTTFPDGSHPPPQPGNHFSAWGATLAGAVYDSGKSDPIVVHSPGTIERQINLSYTANGPTAVVAWGGHLASVLDWGQGNTFKSGGGNGSSFHMRLATGGNQELSINVNGIAAQPPSFTTQVAPASMTTDQTVIDTAALTAAAGNPVRGAVQFFVCGPAASAAPDCSQGGSPVGGPQVVALVPPPNGPNGQATIAFPEPGEGPVEPGRYCFRAEYTPSEDAAYSPALHTSSTTECFVVTLPPPHLTVTKVCVPASDPGLFDLLLDGTVVPNGTDVPCGGSRGPFDTTVGTHTVSENAGTGTSLTDYTSTSGGDCAVSGSITLVLGDSKTCTITNVRLGEPTGFLTVEKVCVPAGDPGHFEIHVDGDKVAELSCGETTEPIELPPGGHTVSEASGVRTSRSGYTTVISGDCAADGSVTVVANQTAHCTITNTRIPPSTTLRVNKLCRPAADDGHFRVGIFKVGARRVHRVVLPCGGTTGVVQVPPGTYLVRERGANGTQLSDYRRFIGGDCLSTGIVTLQAGDHATCWIANVRRGPGPQPAVLTVTKICDPADDGGRFDLTVDGQTAPDVSCGDSFGPVPLPPGQHHVSESAGTGTSLADYTTTIGGACAADGSVTLAAGQQATCTITNVRGTSPPEPPDETGTVEIEKQCLPAGTRGNFQLEFDEHVFFLSCGQSTGTVVVPVGKHRVGEVAVNGVTSRFTTTIGGDCAPDGSFTLNAGEHVACVVTNTLVAPIRPPKPPHVCYRLTARPRTATAGKPLRVVALVHIGRRPVRGVRVHAVGSGVSAVRTTGPRGVAVFALTPRRRGILRVAIRRPFLCPKPPPHTIGVRGVNTPPVTG
jgi:Prealbumin-like fold domain